MITVRILNIYNLVGSVFIPMIGLFLFLINDAVDRKVPSPPADNMASAHSNVSWECICLFVNST